MRSGSIACGTLLAALATILPVGPAFEDQDPLQAKTPEKSVQATKPSDTEIVLKHTFAAPREKVFGALTQSEQIMKWMKPANMDLVSSKVDLRVGGTFCHVFKRPSGKMLEVRGKYEAVDPP